MLNTDDNKSENFDASNNGNKHTSKCSCLILSDFIEVRYFCFVSLSSLAPQLLVGPGLLKKLCPFVSFEGDFLTILDT